MEALLAAPEGDPSLLPALVAQERARLEGALGPLAAAKGFAAAIARWVIERAKGRALLPAEAGPAATEGAALAAAELIARGQARRVLVLAPAQRLAWWRERLGHAPTLSAFALGAASRTWEQDPCDLLVLEGAEALQGPSSARYQAVQSIHRAYALVLSAAPALADLDALHALVELVRPGLLGTRRALRAARDLEVLRARLRDVVLLTQLPEHPDMPRAAIHRAPSKMRVTRALKASPDAPARPDLRAAPGWTLRVESVRDTLRIERALLCRFERRGVEAPDQLLTVYSASDAPPRVLDGTDTFEQLAARALERGALAALDSRIEACALHDAGAAARAHAISWTQSREPDALRDLAAAIEELTAHFARVIDEAPRSRRAALEKVYRTRCAELLEARRLRAHVEPIALVTLAVPSREYVLVLERARPGGALVVGARVDLAKGETSVPACGACGETRRELAACLAGSHVVCARCACACAGCDATLCEGCAPWRCARCARPLCDACSGRCDLCAGATCPTHRMRCAECGAQQCEGCSARCGACARVYCANHASTCARCDEPCCGACAARCAGCGARVCPNDRATCAECGRVHCMRCLRTDAQGAKICADDEFVSKGGPLR